MANRTCAHPHLYAELGHRRGSRQQGCSFLRASPLRSRQSRRV